MKKEREKDREKDSGGEAERVIRILANFPGGAIDSCETIAIPFGKGLAEQKTETLFLWEQEHDLTFKSKIFMIGNYRYQILGKFSLRKHNARRHHILHNWQVFQH